MNWQRFTTSLQRPTPTRQVRYRPNLIAFEERIVPASATLYVDYTQSFLTVTATVTTPLGSANVQEQAPGSLTTSYEGSIQVDLDFNAQTIQFLYDGGQLFADVNGQWQPDVGGGAGSADANYGGQFQLLGNNLTAIRNLFLSNTSDVLPMYTGDNVVYGFPSVQYLTTASGNLDYNTVFFGNGDLDITGLNGQNQADDSYLVDNGDGTFTMIANYNVTIAQDLGSGASFVMNISGQLVATGSYDMSPASLAQGAGQKGDLFSHVVAVQTASQQSAKLSNPVDSTLSGQTQVLKGSLDQGGTTHHGGTATAVDAVFQDPLQGTL